MSSEDVEVIQADVDSAARWARRLRPLWPPKLPTRDPAYDALIEEFARHRATHTQTGAVPREPTAEMVEPWADYHGDLPDYDHPLRCVYESGIQYAVELLAKELGVENYEPCDGTEEFDGDLGGTMMNIVLAAMPKDEHGDPVHPRDAAPKSGAGEDARGLLADWSSAWVEYESPYDDRGLPEQFAAVARHAFRAGHIAAALAAPVTADTSDEDALTVDRMGWYANNPDGTFSRAELAADARAAFDLLTRLSAPANDARPVMRAAARIRASDGGPDQ